MRSRHRHTSVLLKLSPILKKLKYLVYVHGNIVRWDVLCRKSDLAYEDRSILIETRETILRLQLSEIFVILVTSEIIYPGIWRSSYREFVLRVCQGGGLEQALKIDNCSRHVTGRANGTIGCRCGAGKN